MSRLFVVFRTYDTIWSCKTYTKELSPFVIDSRSTSDVKLMFSVDPISFHGKDDRPVYLGDDDDSCPHSPQQIADIYCRPHRNFKPCFLHVTQSSRSECHRLPVPVNPHSSLRRYSLPNLSQTDITSLCESPPDSSLQENVFYVLPRFKCTLVVDSHLSSAISQELMRSRHFRRRFLRCVKRSGGFRDCLVDYAGWTEEERAAWDSYLTLPFMIDIVAVWPQQKIDFPWQYKILSLLHMHMSLDEGFAWLSTLGGAHSALGEIFLQHAEQAGKISKQQLKVAKLLGNTPMMARCYIFWSWSLIQKWELKRGRKCIRTVWAFSKTLAVRDVILENMCLAVWSRLKYRWSLLHGRGGHVGNECVTSKNLSKQLKQMKLNPTCDNEANGTLLSSGDGKSVESLPVLRTSSPVQVC